MQDMGRSKKNSNTVASIIIIIVKQIKINHKLSTLLTLRCMHCLLQVCDGSLKFPFCMPAIKPFAMLLKDHTNHSEHQATKICKNQINKRSNRMGKAFTFKSATYCKSCSESQKMAIGLPTSTISPACASNFAVNISSMSSISM